MGDLTIPDPARAVLHNPGEATLRKVSTGHNRPGRACSRSLARLWSSAVRVRERRREYEYIPNLPTRSPAR
jgi:hypothetical protein